MNYSNQLPDSEMNKAAKNELQEICQKRGLAFPIYECYMTNGGWKSSARVMDYSAESKVFSKKVDAENDAAAKIVSMFGSRSPSISRGVPESIFKNCPFPRYLHLVDGENVNLDPPPQSEDTAWFVFYFLRNSKVSKPQYVETILTTCSRKDGADTYIQVFVGKQLSENPRLEKIFIHTLDKFGYALADVISEISDGRVTGEVV